MSEITRPTPRDTVLAYLEKLATGDVANDANEGLETAQALGKGAFFDGLADVMETGSGQIRLLACCSMIAQNPKTKLADRACRILGDVLQTGSPDEQLMAGYWLFFTGTATKPLVSTLEQLFDRHPADDNRRLWFAGALLQAAQPDQGQMKEYAKARTSLYTALRFDDLHCVIIAAMALGRAQLHVDEIRKSLKRSYAKADPAFRQMILSQFANLGACTDKELQLITRAAVSVDEDPGVRVAAITVLARLPGDAEIIVESLVQILNDNDWHLVSLALGALSVRLKVLPLRAVDKLRELLSHPTRDFRGLAATHLTDAGGAIGIAIPTLVERLMSEEDDEVLEAIELALGAAGAPAIPSIMKALTTSGLRHLHLFQYALLAIGRRDARALAGAMSSPDMRTRQCIAWVLQSLGPAAEPAVEVLEPLLSSDDNELVQDVLIAFDRMGRMARSAADGMARLLLRNDLQTRQWAENALVSIGSEAIPALTALRDGTPVAERPPIDAVLKRLSCAVPTVEHRESSGFYGITNRDDLKLFAIVGDLLLEHGPLSFMKLQIAIDGLPVGEEIGHSSSQIRLMITRLEAALPTSEDAKAVLVNRGNNRKGGLTEAGKEIHRRVMEYLHRTSPQPGDVRRERMI